MVAKSLPEDMRKVKEDERKTLLQVIQASTNGVCQVICWKERTLWIPIFIVCFHARAGQISRPQICLPY